MLQGGICVLTARNWCVLEREDVTIPSCLWGRPEIEVDSVRRANSTLSDCPLLLQPCCVLRQGSFRPLHSPRPALKTNLLIQCKICTKMCRFVVEFELAEGVGNKWTATRSIFINTVLFNPLSWGMINFDEIEEITRV